MLSSTDRKTPFNVNKLIQELRKILLINLILKIEKTSIKVIKRSFSKMNKTLYIYIKIV